MNPFDSLEDKMPSIVVEIAVAVLILGGIMGSIWLYSGQPFPGSPPLVVIESGSMMHENEPFGRLGTIDPGDIVLAKAVHQRGDVITHGGKFGGAKFVGAEGYKTYGDYGDVIIYKPMGRTDVLPIIHRAMCWIEYDENNGTYTVQEYGIRNASSVTIPELDLYGYQPHLSGFITKGDNNELPDQHPMAKICEQPVKLEWVIGKAQGELPWFGSLKLLFTGNAGDVNQDTWICLALSIITLVSIPLSLDLQDYLREKKGKKGMSMKGWRHKLKS
ncbi:MAG TPA: S26 family signal peptidase, partial [Thermoplasmata archaeon]|nr:S26 family signal peptidase [Thermoplasmata archaeon]